MRYSEFQRKIVVNMSAYLSSGSKAIGFESLGVEQPDSMTINALDLIDHQGSIVEPTNISALAISQSELISQYEDLGAALNDLAEIDDEEWSIDDSVYYVACYAASSLMDNGIPAPKVFTHGSKSVVFNWVAASKNLYLTLSENTISALISNPKNIEARLQFNVTQLESPEVIYSSIDLLRSGGEAVAVSASVRN